ncbi:MAG TPA: glutamate--tRNA ligase [Fimbriimonadaceae bacterium]|nr:glutamate--tRNA ligase [Fimbriimonadaceae bacterium]
MSVRVRYAPSPTGSPHVGNVRTALFCHLFAKRMGGVNILRLEDTDRSRYVPGCEEEIVEGLRWLGIEWQEGLEVGGTHEPYRQSQRKEAGVYAEWIDKLLAAGHAYKAFDTPEELTEMREYQQINKQPVGYFGGVWRDASGAEIERAEAEGKPFVIRLKMPRGRKLTCRDAIRGLIEWDAEDSDDPVLIKADGMPTYHCAAMVDDHLMGITHVIRGEEWISSAPKHVWLYEAFGWEPPTFVHVPVILGTDGKKLSKRHGDTRLLDYRAAGYLPSALVNFIALIGWSPGGDRELMSMREMEEAFDLEGLQPSPGVFDIEKLLWMNGHYLRQLTPDELVEEVRAYVAAPDTDEYWNRADFVSTGTISLLERLEKELSENSEMAVEALKLEQQRVTTLAEFGEATAFFFEEEPPMDAKAVEKWLSQPHVAELFEYLIGKLGGEPEAARPAPHPVAVAPDHTERRHVSIEECERLIRSYAEDHGFEKLGPVVHPTRVALTGKTVGPGLFELMSVLGPERMVRRLKRALGLIAG